MPHRGEGGAGVSAGVEAVPNVRAQEARGQARLRKRKKAERRRKSPRPHLPQGLEQRHLDLIGLFLIAAGVYLSFVLFFGWEGGKVGYGIETGLDYLFGDVGARIVDRPDARRRRRARHRHLDLARSSAASAAALRRVFLGGRGVAETAIQNREERRQEKTTSDFETRAGATDVMSTYPEEDEFEPTVALADERRRADDRRSPDAKPRPQDFDAELDERDPSPRRTRPDAEPPRCGPDDRAAPP